MPCSSLLVFWALIASQSPRCAEALASRLVENVFRTGLEKSSEQTGLAQAVAHELEARSQAGQAPTVVSHKNWFQRLGDSLVAVLLGLFAVIPFSISFLWVNERRNAQLEVVLSWGGQEAETIETDQKDLPDYDGALVHLNGEIAKGLEPVKDERFPDVRVESGCLRLRTCVEVFQWEEQEHSETKKDNLGGGETTVKTYSYQKAWCSSTVNSSGFKQGGHQNTVHVQGLAVGSQEVVNGLVKYGEPYQLQKDMVMQLSNFQDAHKAVGEKVQFHAGTLQNYTFVRQGTWYCYPASAGSSPEVGDVRASFEYVLDGPATILALQLTDKRSGQRSFGPYRSVSHGCCGSKSDEELKRLRVRAAGMDSQELYEQDKCPGFGPLACLCCCCNMVTMCFSAMMPPQIYSAWPGVMSKGESLASEKAMANMKKWGFRLMGWVLLWIGFMMLFEPLTTVLDIIPFLGKYISAGAGYIIGFFTFVLTLAVASLIVSVAYMLYHPLIGLCYMAITGGVFGLVSFLIASNAPAS